MSTLAILSQYHDENGNTIDYAGSVEKGVRIVFVGSNNRLVVNDGAKITDLSIRFDCDNAHIEIGACSIKGSMLIGQDCRILVEDGVTSSGKVFITAAEGTEVTIGEDCMFSSDITVRTHDSHPIFDVATGMRSNVAKSISIGRHVWVGADVAILGGSSIGDGSVIGMRSVVKGKFPNNVVVVGMPAKTVKRNIAWERPHLTGKPPFYKRDASTVKKSAYWDMTREEPVVEKKWSLLKIVKNALGKLRLRPA